MNVVRVQDNVQLGGISRFGVAFSTRTSRVCQRTGKAIKDVSQMVLFKL